MKPIVIYDVKKYDGDDNLLLIDKVKFEKLLEDVYQAGFEDGKKPITTITYPQTWRDFEPSVTYCNNETGKAPETAKVSRSC
jgi:hypothetical protein